MLISKKRYKEIQRAAICCKKFSKTEEPFAALKNLDVEYSLINLEGDLPGFINSDYNSGKQYSPHVYINKRYGKYSQKIIAAHELGHVLLHKMMLLICWMRMTKIVLENMKQTFLLWNLCPKYSQKII